MRDLLGLMVYADVLVDLKAVQHEATESHLEIQESNEARRVTTGVERLHMAAMEDLGLEDGDQALEYALALSMGEGGADGNEGGVGGNFREVRDQDRVEEDEAVKAVEAYRKAEEEEMRVMLEMIRLAEERESLSIDR
jgi:hypothetical protein